jgi:TonB-dependent receptor
MLFKKNVLSSSVAVALVGSTMPSFSQAEELEIEEVIVEGGIRASLKKSMDLKRDTVGVADAISAEDMGKFPDTNLAEALQRITGVSIDRSRGEGNKVTVRGFGPDYNMVTLNGRQMPTHSGVSRAYSFGDIASEGIQAVIVKKSGDVAAPSGGIGALIDIISTKPLEAGYVRSFGAKAAIDTSVVTGKTITPEFAGLFSDTFADDTVGVSLSFSAQERNNAQQSASVGGWNTTHATNFTEQFAIPEDNEVDANYLPTDVTNRHYYRPHCGTTTDSETGELRNKTYEEATKVVDDPSTDFVEGPCLDSLSIPQSMAYNLSEFTSERINSQLTLQYSPLDALTATVDYTYSQMEVDRNYNDLSAWFNGQSSISQSSQWENSDDPIGSPLVYREVSDNGDFPMGVGHDGSINTNSSLGLNLEVFATDRLKLEFDFHDSTAESKANSPSGTSSLVTMASFNRTVSKIYFTEDMPILELGLNPQDLRTASEGEDVVVTDSQTGEETVLNLVRPLYAGDMIITGSVFGNNLNKMNIEQFRFKGTYDASDFTSVDFGLELSEVSNRTRSSVVERGTWGGISDPNYLTDILDLTSMEDYFADVSGGDYKLRQMDSFYTTLEELTEKARALPITEIDPVTGTCVPEPYVNFYCASDDWTVDKATTEETSVVFIKTIHDTMIMDFPANITAGLRYENTEVSSVATVPNYKGTTWAGGNEITLVRDEGVSADEYKGDYGILLPTFDLQLELTYDVVGRFSASKTVTRPNYNDIKGGITADGGSFKQGGYSASSGNPGLNPIKSLNLDLSLEWYYGETDYVSMGLFHKDVSNFIGSEFTYDNLWGVRDVLSESNGEFAATLNENGLEPSEKSEVAKLLGINKDNVLESNADNDLARFRISQPANKDNAKVEGIELNIQHNFGETGFGVIANATFVKSNVAFEPDDIFNQGQFALSGLSDSANLIGYYDKDGFNIRLAYNWRDDFFNGIGQGQGGVYNDVGVIVGNNVTNTEAYGQLDMSASYEFSDNLTVFMDGLNVTNSTYRVYGREKSQVLAAGQTGARYNLGLRYSF